MIAVYGTRGSGHHRHRYVTTRAEAETFFDECRAFTEKACPAAVGQPTAILSDGNARSVRWLNGRRAYPEADPVYRNEMDRASLGLCRHCGGRVPCWSDQGDSAPGVRHTATTASARARGVY